MFMLFTMAGTMAALAAFYLYRGRRTRSRSTTASSNNEPSSSASSSSFKNNHVDKGKKAKRYTSD